MVEKFLSAFPSERPSLVVSDLRRMKLRRSSDRKARCVMEKMIKKMMVAGLACVALCGSALAAPKHGNGPAPGARPRWSRRCVTRPASPYRPTSPRRPTIRRRLRRTAMTRSVRRTACPRRVRCPRATVTTTAAGALRRPRTTLAAAVAVSFAQSIFRIVPAGAGKRQATVVLGYRVLLTYWQRWTYVSASAKRSNAQSKAGAE